MKSRKIQKKTITKQKIGTTPHTEKPTKKATDHESTGSLDYKKDKKCLFCERIRQHFHRVNYRQHQHNSIKRAPNSPLGVSLKVSLLLQGVPIFAQPSYMRELFRSSGRHNISKQYSHHTIVDTPSFDSVSQFPM